MSAALPRCLARSGRGNKRGGGKGEEKSAPHLPYFCSSHSLGIRNSQIDESARGGEGNKLAERELEGEERTGYRAGRLDAS